MKRIIAIFALVAGSLVLVSAPAHAAKQTRIDICHATGSETNPYVLEHPTIDQLTKSHIGLHEDDIIPAFENGDNDFAGQNLDLVGWIANDCNEPGGEPQEGDDLTPSVSTTAASCSADGAVVATDTATILYEVSEPDENGVVEVFAETVNNGDKLVAVTGWDLAPNKKSGTTSVTVPEQLTGTQCDGPGVPQEVPAKAPPLPDTGGENPMVLALGALMALAGAGIVARRRLGFNS